jgi:hypothetical protein
LLVDETADDAEVELAEVVVESLVAVVVLDVPAEPSAAVVELTAAIPFVLVPAYVAAASQPNPAEAARPARVVPMVRFRRRRVARDRATAPPVVKVFMSTSLTGGPFGSMTRSAGRRVAGLRLGCHTPTMR